MRLRSSALLAAFVLTTGGGVAGAQEGAAPDNRPPYRCQVGDTGINSHSLVQGEISSPIRCEDTSKSAQTFVTPSSVVGTLTVSESVRKALGLASKRVASGKFSGPKAKNFWIRLSPGARSKLKHVRLIGVKAEVTITVPDGTKIKAVGPVDGVNNRILGMCKILSSGRLVYRCDNK